MITTRKWMIGTGILLMLATGTTSAADFSSWQKKMPITFSGYTRPETLTNFPALVVLSTNISGFSYSDFLSLTNQDLRFTAADGTNELNYEIESWNTNGSSYVWLQVTNLVDTNTAVWAYWGRSGTSAPAYTTNGATWANGFSGVWHMSQTNALDSSPSRRNGSVVGGTVATVTGVVDGADSFSAGYVVATSPVQTSGNTVSLWFNANNVASGQKGIFTTGSSPVDGTPHMLLVHNNASIQTYNSGYQTVATIASQTWYCLTLVHSTTNEKVYLNGAYTTSRAWSTAGNNANIYIGSGYSANFQGQIDEFQVSTVLRSSNWIWACYMNQASNGVYAGSFNTYGAVQQLPGPNLPQIANVGSPRTVATAGDVVGRLLTNGTSAATLFLYWSTNDCTTNATAWTTGGNVTNLGSWADGATVTNTLTGLSQNTTYYWNHSAVNASGTVWAATVGSPSFKTLAPPGINNGAGATSIGVSTATLNGCLTNGTTARVFFLRGTQDGVWTTTNDLGTLSEGAFSNTVSDLTPGTTNYYTCYATNECGVTLASPSVAFVTAHGWTGGGSSSYASEAANWAGGRPGTGDTVVLDSTTNKNMIWDAGSNGLPDTVAAWRQTAGYTGTVTVQTVYGATGFTNFTISGDADIGGGTLTHRANTTSEVYRLAMTVNGNLTIGTNASIGTLGLGYSAGYGPGGGGTATHGGVGSGGSQNVYGSIFAPVNLGSGGNNTGGGAIRLIVGGTLTHYGTITASTPTGSYTGAGGSIYITAGAIAGSPTGVVKASGTPDGSSNSGGGGGRVSVVLTNTGATFSTYTGGMQAYGGWVGVRSGAAGTVYKETAAQGTGHGTLIIDNAGGYDLSTSQVFTLMPSGTDLSVFEQVIIRNNGFLAVTSGSLLDFGTAHIAGQSCAAAHIAILNTNAVVFPNPFAFSNYTLNINVPLVTTGLWTIKSGGRLSHSAGLSLNFTINGDLTVDSGGQLHADGRNASGGLGEGSTSSAYGGLGGDPASMGATYGSVIAPAARGSGGYAGGLITLTVTGTLTNNGTISAAGLGARTSGGGINITTGSLIGNGTIQAPGGGGDNGYSGGGGRVAVVLTKTGATFSSYSGSISAYGGFSNFSLRGAAGTVYKAIAGLFSGCGTVLVDNGGYTNSNLTCLTSLPSAPNSTEVIRGSSWTVQNRGKIGLVTNTTIANLVISSSSFLNLAGYTGTVSALTIGSSNYPAGTYAATNLGTTLSDTSGGRGRILVVPPGLYVDDAGILEGASGSTTNLSIPIRLLNLSVPVSFDYFTTSLTAEADSDYTPVSGSMSVADGISQTNVLVTIHSDDWLEPDESFHLIITNVTGATAFRSEAICTISNDDNRTISITPAVEINPEGPSGTDTSAVFGITLSQAIGTDATFQYTTLNGTATAPGDYTAVVSATGTIAAGTTSTNLSITLHGDDSDEPLLEDFQVILSNPSANATLANATGTCTIVDDDGPPAIMLSGTSVTEGDSGTTTAHFIVSLNAPSADTISFNYRTLDGTATAPADYTSITGGAGSIAPGHLQTTVDVAVTGDTWIETDESYTLQLYTIVNADPLITNAVCTILNEDEPFVWTGASGTGLASTMGNWRTRGAPATRLPCETDLIKLDATSNSNLTWDAGVNGLSARVSDWTQTAAYSGTVTIRTLYGATGFTNFTISGNASILGGTWTHPTNTTSEINRLRLTVNGNLTVGPAAKFDVTGFGYSANYGSGTGNGAAHGGRAGSYSTYGSIFAPVNLGSGGGAGAGGGAIWLNVEGTLTLDGTMIASSYQGGDARGAGGSIYITVGSLTGTVSGIIRATGSLISTTQSTGSGGRIAVILTNEGATFSDYRGIMRACGGKLNAGTSGAAGTVYQETPAQGSGHGVLIIDNEDSLDMSSTIKFTPMPTGVDPSVFTQIIIRKNGILGVSSGTVLNFGTANITGESGASAHLVAMNSDAVVFPNTFAFSNYTLNLNFPLVTTGQWTIKSGGRLSHSAGMSLNLSITGDLTIDAGGQIHADGRNASGGLGAGTTCAYGGQGGDPASMGASYGSIIAPAARGSGGDAGGLITLTVTGTLTNNGTISAASLGARTSGGGINITTGTLKGNGTIQAPGGGGDNGYSGGGGRVAVVLTATGADFSGYSGSISSYGGHSYFPRRGAAGTVYKAIAGLFEGGGTVLVDNGGYTNSNLACLTPLPAFANSTESLNRSFWSVQNRGKVGLLTNATIWSLTLNSNSYLELTGHTLTTCNLSITNKTYEPAIYTAAQLGSLVSDSSGGSGRVIVVDPVPQGTIYLMR